MFFTSDTHFDHGNILKYTNRPFTSLEEMNEALIANWNAVVPRGSTVYIVGDFAFKRHEYFAKRLQGQLVLVEGSHDKMSGKARKAFTWVGPRHIVKGEPDIILSHYAMRVWPRSHYGTWHLYGHSHGTLPGRGFSFDVGVDAHSYAPLSLEQVREIMSTRTIVGGVDGRYLGDDQV